jgi:hypothetical protein
MKRPNELDVPVANASNIGCGDQANSMPKMLIWFNVGRYDQVLEIAQSYVYTLGACLGIQVKVEQLHCEREEDTE